MASGLPERKVLNKIIKKVALRLSKDSGALAVALRGSLVSGHATARSDIDLLVITKRGFRRTTGEQIDGIPFHIRYFPLSYIRLMLRERNPRIIEFLVNSKPLHEKSGAYKRVMRNLKDFPSKQFLSDFIQIGGHNLSDAQGQFQEGNYESAILLARSGSLQLLTGLLLKRGKIVFKERHIVSALKSNKELARLNSSFKKVQGLDGIGKEEAKQVLFESLRIHDKIAAEVS